MGEEDNPSITLHLRLGFVGVSALVIATPGPDTALTIRNALTGGRRAGIWTSFFPLLALGLVFALMTLTWLSAYAIAVARAGAFLRRRPIARLVDGLTGLVLVGLGIRLAHD